MACLPDFHVSNVLSFRDKLKDCYEEIRKALAELDEGGRGSLSLWQVQGALQDCGCPLQEGELTELLGRFALTS